MTSSTTYADLDALLPRLEAIGSLDADAFGRLAEVAKNHQ